MKRLDQTSFIGNEQVGADETSFTENDQVGVDETSFTATEDPRNSGYAVLMENGRLLPISEEIFDQELRLLMQAH